MEQPTPDPRPPILVPLGFFLAARLFQPGSLLTLGDLKNLEITGRPIIQPLESYLNPAAKTAGLRNACHSGAVWLSVYYGQIH